MESLEEWEKEKKETERLNAKVRQELEKRFFEREKYWKGLLAIFEIYFDYAFSAFKEEPKVKSWKLSAVDGFSLDFYLGKLWDIRVKYCITKRALENSWKRVEEKPSGVSVSSRGIPIPVDPEKDYPAPKNYPEAKSLLFTYHLLCKKIKKLLYEKGSSYKTFWLDEKFCKQLSKMLKQTMEKQLKKFDEGKTEVVRPPDETMLRQVEEINVEDLGLSKKEKRDWRIIAENVVARFVNDLEEVRKEVRADFREVEYSGDIIKKWWKWILGGLFSSVVLPFSVMYLVCLNTKSPGVCFEETFAWLRWFSWWPWLSWVIGIIGFVVVGVVIYFNRDFFWRKLKKS